MKHALRTLSLLALMAHAVPLAALAPADVARLEQEVRAAITAGDYLIAQDLIARLEGAGARATAQPLMVQLSKALEKRAIGAAELERQYRNLEARELVPLRRLRVELENQVGRLKKDLEVSRKFGQEQQEKVGAAGRRIRTLEKQLEVEQNQREQAETAYNDLRAKFTSSEKNLRDLIKERDELLDDNANKIDRVADLEQQVKDLTANVTTLQNKAQQFQKENELLIQKATELSVINDDLKAAITEASRVVQQTANRAAGMSISELQTAISEIADKVKSLL